jgi:hypothetical protein
MNEKRKLATIHIDPIRKAKLKAIGKQHRKKFFDDVVAMLIDYYERTKEQKPMESLPKAKAQSDVSLSSESLKERAEKNPMLKEALEKIKEPTPPPPCNYCSKGYFDNKRGQIVYCDDPKRRGKSKEPIEISIEACLKCWERIQWVKSKRESMPEPKPEPMPEPQIMKPKFYPHKTLEDKLRDGTLEWKCELERKTMFLKDVPCLLDHSFKCPFKECEKRIDNIIVPFMEKENERELELMKLRGEKIEQEIQSY